MIKFGYTGTRYGMTPSQKYACTLILKLGLELGPIEVHHGDCVGGDADIHAIALTLKQAGAPVRIVIHPPIDDKHRAWCTGADEVRDPLTHFARNRAIVDETIALIAGPLEQERQPRGGTWYTYDYAIKRGRTVALVLRNQFDMADMPSSVSYACLASVQHTWPTRQIKLDDR